MRGARVCAALATCGVIGGLGMVSSTATGCLRLGPTDLAFDASSVGGGCWILCGGISLGGNGCAHGTASCGADASACETPTLNDDTNCGDCGVRCPAGNRCNDGSCFAVEDLASWDNRFPQPSQGLAVGGGLAYLAFLSQPPPSGLVAVPTSGGSPRTLTADAVGPLYADSQGVYFVDQTNTALLTMSPTDKAPRTLLSDASDLSAIVGTSSQSIFYGTVQSQAPNPPTSIVELGKSGGTPSTLASDKSVPPRGAPFAAMAGNDVYWIDAGDLWQLPLGGSSLPTQVTSDGAATAIVGSANAVYTLTQSGAVRYDIATGKGTTIASHPFTASSLAADDGALYFTTADSVFADGDIVRLAANGTMTVLAGAQGSALTLAIDDQYVYWWVFEFSDDAGAPQRLVLRRVPKSP